MYSTLMTKHTAIIFLGVLVIVTALGGFPSWLRTTILVVSGLGISILSYLSSVMYCSNCKKLIEDAELALPSLNTEDEASQSLVR